MGFDEGLAQRLREIFARRSDVTERKMFGGLAFMLDRKMCCGVVGDDLMARVGPGQYAGALVREHVREMDFTGRPLRGFVYVSPGGTESDEALAGWVARCERFVDSLPAK